MEWPRLSFPQPLRHRARFVIPFVTGRAENAEISAAQEGDVSRNRTSRSIPLGLVLICCVQIQRRDLAVISGQGLPTRLSTDHDPLFRFHRWQANLRVLDVETLQTVPQIPWSHPFIERLIATIRLEYLDRLFFWTADDLERKLELFKKYYSAARLHQGLSGDTHGEKAGGPTPQPAGLENYRWQSHCHGLFELPIAA